LAVCSPAGFGFVYPVEIVRKFALRAFGEFGRDRGNVNQNTPTRDQRGDTPGFDFVSQPSRRDAQTAGRQVQR
jgi:hypothetical protein